MVAALCVSCGSPAAPGAEAPPFADGRFTIELLGDSKGCPSDAPQFSSGGLLVSLLNATHDAAGTWIARSASSFDGTLEIRLKRSNIAVDSPCCSVVSGRNYVVGTITGTTRYSWDFGLNGPVAPASFLLEQTAVFPGNVPTDGAVPDPKFGSGYITGTMMFVEKGRTSTCAPRAASWTLNGPF
jgi:hypothetical protein